MKARKFKNMLYPVIFGGSAFFIAGMFFLILLLVFINGLPSLNFSFLLMSEHDSGMLGGGIANAIAGTVMISLFSTMFAIPLALGTALYLTKYARKSRFVDLFRFLLEVLSGTPSIIVGIFGLLFICYYFRFLSGGYSLISGSIALGILIMPVIERSIEHALISVPRDLEEGSFAMGANKWQTIRHILIPTALPGILTGIILGFGRAAEESAVVILTAGYSQFFPEFRIGYSDHILFNLKVYPLHDIAATLPYTVYNSYHFHSLIPLSNGFAAAFVLICFVLLINLTAKIILWYSTRTAKSPSPLLSSLTRTLFGRNGRFSRGKPVPLPACAAAEIAEAERDAAIRRARGAASPAKVTPSPVSTTSEIDWRQTLGQGLQADPIPAGGVHAASGGLPLVVEHDDPLLEPPGALLPVGEELFEDEPALLLSEIDEGDAESALAALEAALGGEPALMEEEPGRRVAEQPDDENWRRIAKNRLENTIAGITADPGEWV